MLQRDHILKRIEYVQAELTALARLVDIADLTDEGTTLPASTTFAEAREAAFDGSESREAEAPNAGRKLRWRYQPGTFYRVVGENPFRNGNNYNLFEYLRSRFGDQPFSREQLSEAIATLARKGRVDTVQGEDTFVMVFLRTAGALKHRIEMAPRPRGGEVSPKAEADGALPPEPGDVPWRLEGQHGFRRGSINWTLWNALEGQTFSRDELARKVEDMVGRGELASTRPAPVVARDFLGHVLDRGLAARA